MAIGSSYVVVNAIPTAATYKIYHITGYNIASIYIWYTVDRSIAPTQTTKHAIGMTVNTLIPVIILEVKTCSSYEKTVRS